MRYAFALLSALSLPAASTASFRVCGNYCGPGWCNGGWISEGDCDDSVSPETHSLTGPSCADVCCRSHDACCGHSSHRNTCNTALVDCLSKCDPASVTCTNDGVPVPAGGIEAAMDIVESWCCGERCPPTLLRPQAAEAVME